MEYNPIFTNLDIKNIIENIYNTSVYRVVFENNTSIEFNDYMTIQFYAFKFDAMLHSYTNYYDSPDSIISAIIGSGEYTPCLVEQYNRETSYSKGFETLTTNVRLTFAVREEQIAILESYIQFLHETRRAQYDLYETIDGQRYKYYLDFGSLEVQGDSFQSSLGKVAICQVEVKLGAILNAIAYGSGVDYRLGLGTSIEEWPYDAEGTTTQTKPLLFNTLNKNVSFQTRPATIYQKTIGQILTSGSGVFVFDSYDFAEEDTIMKEVIARANMCISTRTYRNGVDIRPDTVLNEDLAVVFYEIRDNIVYAYRCIMTSFTEETINSEFVKRTITLQLKPELEE